MVKEDQNLYLGSWDLGIQSLLATNLMTLVKIFSFSELLIYSWFLVLKLDDKIPAQVESHFFQWESLQDFLCKTL